MGLVNITHGRGTPLFVDYPPNLIDFALFCCVLFIILGVPGNLITIIALLKSKKLHNATAVFIVNLTVSDLMFGIFNLPMAASLFCNRAWVHTRFLCLLFPILRYGLVAVSVFTVLAITINRYVMIAHQRLYRRLYTKTSLAVMVVATWIGAFGALVPTLLEFWGTFGLDPAIGSCTILPDADGNSPKAFLFVFAFMLPCLAICVCYARIFCIVHRAYKKSHLHLREPNFPSSNRNSTNLSHQSYEPLTFQTVSASDLDVQVQVSTCRNSITTGIPKPVEKSVAEQKLENETNNGTSKTNKLPLRFTALQTFKDISTETPSYVKPENTVYFQTPSSEFPASMTTSATAAGTVKSFSGTETPLPNEVEVPPLKATVERRPSTKSSKSTNISFMRGTMRRRRATSLIARQQTLSPQDRRLLKMILVIFVSFVACYLPITLVKIFGKDDNPILNILGLLLIYLTTCINPIIYVAMSSEYRQAYVNLLTCKHDADSSNRSVS